MKLNAFAANNPPAGVRSFKYNRALTTPGILHLGVGGFHRSHEALYIEELLESGAATDWAITGVGIMPRDIAIRDAFLSQDSLYTLVERDGRGESARIIGAITSYILGTENPELVFAALTRPEIRIVSLTATEGGYFFDQGSGRFLRENPAIVNDLTTPAKPQTIFGYLAEGLARRKRAEMKPFTVLSCDNLQGNGDIAKKMLIDFCTLRDPELAHWVEANVTFPNSMVDRITPMTTEVERSLVQERYGLTDAAPVISETFRQWVIEDHFCNGRPPLETVGVQFVSDVRPFEKMKIRLLNATHSAMGYLGYLCNYRTIDAIAVADEFQPYLRRFMDAEVTPIVGSVPGIDLNWYKRSLMERFANPTIKDQTLRICMDGSAKLPKFLLPSIQEQLLRDGPITAMTLCVASWLRFLSGKDEQGNEIPIQDPMAERLQRAALLGGSNPTPFLDMQDIFGELGTNPRFTAELHRLLESLYERGARATLNEVNSNR